MSGGPPERPAAVRPDGARGGAGYRGRFAPSPTGSLHIGNARTALVAWLRARRSGGAFVVRVEDLDGPRTREDSVRGNLEELRWLGLDWDEGPDSGGPYGPYRQSARSALYADALARLRDSGAVFDCWLSRKDVASASSAPHGSDAGGPLYGAAQRRLNQAVAAARRAEGRAASQRLSVGEGAVEFHDALAGPQSFDAATQLGDVVMRRADGLWAYQLAVVVDDAAMGITEVARGADLLASTATQLLVYRALGLTPPAFAHVGLLLDEHGQRLSKRGGALSLGELKAAGVAPARVAGLLAYTLGWLAAPRELAAADLSAAIDPVLLDTAPAEPVRLAQRDLAFLSGG